MHHGRCHAEEPLKICLGGWRTVNLGVVVDEREVLPLLGCERLARLDHWRLILLHVSVNPLDGRHPLFLAPRTSATNGQRPVLERESLHAVELGSVVRDEPEPERARVSGDEEVIGSNHLAALL